MKIKKITVTESEEDLQTPLYLKRKDEMRFAAIHKDEWFEIYFFTHASPSLYHGAHSEEKLNSIIKEHTEPSTREEFENGLNLYVQERKKWNKKYLTIAAEVMQEITKKEESKEFETIKVG